MRMARIKIRGRSAVYHCISRVVGGEGLLDDLGKETLARMVRQQAAFCGVEVITYCLMINHFHLLVRVPEEDQPTDAELLGRMEALYGPRGSWVQLARQGLQARGQIDPDLRQAMQERMGDVSEFMKELKQRFSRWYNRRMERFGTLWAERFKSVVVEDQPGVLATVAAYIDLNPVRAGLVTDPKDYRFCGYAAATAGDQGAQAGLLSFARQTDWARAAAAYRQQLFVGSGVAGQAGKVVLDREQIKRVLAAGGQLSPGQVLRLRIRHLSDGLALGSQGFVEELFVQYRERFGPKRRSGARPIRGVPLDGLMSLRDLRVAAVT